MNKKQLTVQLAKRTGLSKNKCRCAVNALFGVGSKTGIIEDALRSGDRVVILGFGTFNTRILAKRVVFSPYVRQKIEIPSSTYVTFKAGNNLRRAVASTSHGSVGSEQRGEVGDVEAIEGLASAEVSGPQNSLPAIGEP